MNKYEQDMEQRWQRLQEPLKRANTTHVPAGVLQLARVVAGVPDPEMTCEECQAWLPSYVDDEIGALPVQTLYPKVKRHLELCDECVLEYLQMRDWALAADEGRLPQNIEIPTPDLSFLPKIPPALSVFDYVRSIAAELVQFLTPKERRTYQSTVEKFFRRLSKREPNFAFESQHVFSDDETTPVTVMQFLKTTHNTTQTLLQEFSASDLSREVRRGTLQATLRERASEEARRQGFSSQQAQRFAEQYAEVVCQTPGTLQSLLTP